jgi:hypothetical protein
MAPIKLAKYGSVDMDFVLGVGGYDLERLMLLSLSEESHQIVFFYFISFNYNCSTKYIFPWHTNK